MSLRAVSIRPMDQQPPQGPLPPPPPMGAPPAHGVTGQQNGFAVASLVLGIVGFFFSLIASIPAIVFGILGMDRAKKGAPNEGMALAGLILGIVASAFWILIIIL